MQKREKKGISTIVATVLILLIVIAAVAIIWTAIIPMIKQTSSVKENVDLTIVTSEGYTAYSVLNKSFCVQVKRGVDNADLKGIQFVFDFNGSSSSKEIDSFPEVNQMKVFCFNLSGYGKPDLIKVAPIYADGKIGVFTSEINDIQEGDLSNIGVLFGLGNVTCYGDKDEDGYYNGTSINVSGNCPAPYNSTNLGLDCNDSNLQINPRANEVCDGKDNNCDGAIDEGCDYYADFDGDLFSNGTRAMVGDDGYHWFTLDELTQYCIDNYGDETLCEKAATGDCNDNDASIRPGADEPCDGIDNDCNGVIDDSNAPELCNGIDDNCNGLIDDNVQQPETCNGVDDDCDGLIDEGDACNIAACGDLNIKNAVYTLTADISNTPTNNCFTISADNITLNGNGHTIDGVDASQSKGIYIYHIENITIKNLTITDFYTGLELQYSINSKIEGLIANSNALSGIGIYQSDNGILANSNASSNLNGIVIGSSSNINLTNLVINSNTGGGIQLSSMCNNLSFKNIIVNSNGASGIIMISSSTKNSFNKLAR